jgi:hypothetical protein
MYFGRIYSLVIAGKEWLNEKSLTPFRLCCIQSPQRQEKYKQRLAAVESLAEKSFQAKKNHS